MKSFASWLREDTLYRSGVLSDPLGRGVFLTTKKGVASSYSPMHGGSDVHTYELRAGLKIKDATNRWSLVKEIDPTWNKDKVYQKYIDAQRRNGGKLVDGVTAEQRLTVDAEKRIKKILQKQGYHAVRYAGDNVTDQEGEYQVFDAKNITKS